MDQNRLLAWPARPAARSAPAGRAGVHALVAGPHSTALDGLERCLGRLGLRADGHRTGGGTVWRLTGSGPLPTPVFVDALLGDMTGFEFALRVHAEAALRHVTIIGLHAFDSLEEQRRWRAAGVTRLLGKPASHAAVASLLVPWLPVAGPRRAALG